MGILNLVAGGLLAFMGAAYAQTPIQCNASVPKPLLNDAAGTAEPVGDYIIFCRARAAPVVRPALRKLLSSSIRTSPPRPCRRC